MSEPGKRSVMSVEEYLEFEEHASVKHEYVDGHVFAMTGTTARHNKIAGAVYTLLRSHVRGSSCQAYMADVRARVLATNSFYYPDVMVSCGKYDDNTVFFSDPVFIAEVLSPSTAAIDQREKLYAYGCIESLREYLIVHQTRECAKLHRKENDGTWSLLEYGPGGALILESIPCGVLSFSMDSIFEGTNWKKDGTWEVREDAYNFGSHYDDAAEEEGVLSW